MWPHCSPTKGEHAAPVRGIDLDEEDLASQITIQRNTPTNTTENQDPTPPEVPWTTGVEDPVSAILEDVKLYQDAAIGYCMAYEMLEQKYAEQAHLMEEASGALFAVETQALQKQQELLDLQGRCEAEIWLAVDKALTPSMHLKDQLSSANNNLQAKDKAVKKLQEQVHALESSLANQTELPSVRQPWEQVDLCREVFDYVPGTVNTRRGAATYESGDQAFPFHKHVHFEHRPTVPNLKLDSGSSDPSIPPSHPAPYSSTPSRDARPMDKIFDISQISPLSNDSCAATSIATEVSAAAAAQASKEFCRMREPKITKFKGGYSANAELLFSSWQNDILSNI